MATTLFLVTMVFVAFVLYKSIFGGQQSAESAVVEEKPKAAAKPKVETKPKAADKPESAPAPKAEEKPKAAAKPAAAAGVKVTLKNPATGETASIPGNYRFAKRWIKEALVSEKLLDKVYKNNELDDAAEKKIKTAIDKLKGMKKYQA